MAREAEAAGRDREAAHYRDNLAILGASKLAPEPAGPAKPRTEAPPRPKSTAEKIAAACEKVKDRRCRQTDDLDQRPEARLDRSRAGRAGGPFRARRDRPNPNKTPAGNPSSRSNRPATVSRISGPGTPVPRPG